MDHRKEVHPSTKKCKNFEAGNCIHGDKCWYAHSRDSDSVEANQSMFRCNLCEETFAGRLGFMVHKKQVHSKFVPECEKFSLGKCIRKSEDCWFIHKDTKKQPPSTSVESSSKSVFQNNISRSLPPDSVSKMIELMEKMNLTMQTLTGTLRK